MSNENVIRIINLPPADLLPDLAIKNNSPKTTGTSEANTVHHSHPFSICMSPTPRYISLLGPMKTSADCPSWLSTRGGCSCSCASPDCRCSGTGAGTRPVGKSLEKLSVRKGMEEEKKRNCLGCSASSKGRFFKHAFFQPLMSLLEPTPLVKKTWTVSITPK